MRHLIWLSLAMLPVAGCYAPQPYDPYAATGPGYEYPGGAPGYVYQGAPYPLVQFGGEWGFYDRERHWRRAPDDVHRRMDERRSGGEQFRRPEEPRGVWPGPQGDRRGGPGGFRPPEGARPALPAAAFARPPQPAQPHEGQREHRRDCPQGQRC